jgi:hypothetical protein
VGAAGELEMPSFGVKEMEAGSIGVCVLHKVELQVHLLPMHPQRRLVPGLAQSQLWLLAPKGGPDMSTMVRRKRRRTPQAFPVAHGGGVCIPASIPGRIRTRVCG